MASSADSKRLIAACELNFCEAAAIGDGPLCGLSLCANHLQEDAQKARLQQAELVRKLQQVSAAKDRKALTLESQALLVEMREVNEMFVALHEKIEQWKDKALSCIKAVHDSVSKRLQDAALADEFAKDLSLACSTDAGLVKAMELREVVRPWLRGACERMAEFERVRCDIRNRQAKSRDDLIIDLDWQSDDERLSESSESTDHGLSSNDSDTSNSTDENYNDPTSVSNDSGHGSDEECNSEATFRSVGDVSAGVQHLLYVVERHMNDVMLRCWLFEDGDVPSTDAKPVCRPAASINNLPGDPSHLAFCTNTKGFVCDSSGRVVRGDDAAENCAPLPQPCIFVAFQLGHTDIAEVDHIVVTSLDGGARLQWHCREFNWNNWINGLHIDNNRQLLFIAQSNAVTVVDIGGTIMSVINARSLGQPTAYFGDICGNDTSLFLLDQDFNLLLTVAKDSRQVESVLKLAHPKSNTLLSISPCGSKFLIGDYFRGCVNKICGVSGQSIVSYPNYRTGLDSLKQIWQIAVDSRGRTFVSEYDLGVVRVLAWDGAVLQTIGFSPGVEEQFDGAANMAIIELEERRCLVVSDQLHQRLQVFDLV